MAVKYSHKWTSQFSDDDFIDDAKKIWAMDLSGLTPDQIKQGLDMTAAEYPEWPPTVGQFKQLCKVGDESRRLEMLSLPDKSQKAITPDERKAIIKKHAPNLHKALKGEL